MSKKDWMGGYGCGFHIRSLCAWVRSKYYFYPYVAGGSWLFFSCRDVEIPPYSWMEFFTAQQVEHAKKVSWLEVSAGILFVSLFHHVRLPFTQHTEFFIAKSCSSIQ